MFKLPPSGTWWQDGYPYHLQNLSPTVSVGVRQGPVVLRAGYLLKGESWCLCDPSDARYGAGEKTDELSEFRGHGHLYHFTLSYRWDHKDWYIQLGATAIRSYWKVTVDDWYNLEYPGLPKQQITAEHAKWSVSPEISVGYDVSKNFSVEFRVVPRVGQGGEYTPMFRNPAGSLMVKYAF